MHRNSFHFPKPMIFNSVLSHVELGAPIIQEDSPTDNPPFCPNVQGVLDGRASTDNVILVLPVPE
jgi:hypothetical protein